MCVEGGECLCRGESEVEGGSEAQGIGLLVEEGGVNYNRKISYVSRQISTTRKHGHLVGDTGCPSETAKW